ncbi:hypothetical protein B4080_6388 [Bacillus cereus]|nr:hypothetical protein B4080_6388 [Bacillus cereus]
MNFFNILSFVKREMNIESFNKIEREYISFFLYKLLRGKYL